MRQVWALFKKDARLHGRAFLGSVALLSVIALLIVFVMPRKDVEARCLLVFNLSTVASMLYGQWLIDREKARRTLAWLRATPLSDAHIVSGKAVTLFAFQGALFGVLLSLFAPEALSRIGFIGVAQWLLFMMAFASWLLCGKWLLGERLGGAVAAGAFLVVFGTGFYLVARAWGPTFGPSAPSLAAFVAFTLAVIAPWLVLVRVLSRSDTSRWVG
jgi:ABC-type transport system involved in multi-copper enzyme maturation permease subunit